LVVFLPLAFTSALTYAILGDLAKAVVFSHGFSAIVALILVPTVRLHLMAKERVHHPHKSLFERGLGRLDAAYAAALGFFMRNRLVKWLTYGGLTAILAVLVVFVLPKLPREVIGTPDSDMIFLAMNTKGNTLVRQMETMSDEVEKNLLAEFGDKIGYTFTQINNPNRAFILAKLNNKSDMADLWAALEKRFSDTPVLRFRVEPWNPSELPIPDPADLRVAVRGGDLGLRRDMALELNDMLETGQVFNRVSTYPNVERSQGVYLQADPEQWAAIAREGYRLTPSDLADISRVATTGRRIAKMTINDRETEVILRYPPDSVATPDDLQALPVGLAGKIVPLKSLLPFKLEETAPPVYRENSQDLFIVYGRMNKSEKAGAPAAVAKAKTLIADWQQKKGTELAAADGAGLARPVVAIEDDGKDITQAIDQLGMAIGISILLIFLVLLLQFDSVVESLLVLIAVPLGFIGVIVALYLSGSTLSLNSALGVILLNGIAVNNSIIMVDFIRRLAASGLSPREAATEAARKRLRPILITSLTTILGMMPIALGFGEGGRILQPLGIAVSGGLWISMALTLFLVPALQVSYLEWHGRRAAKAAPHGELATDSNVVVMP
jgi:HAE1 family hydrophobic/amphiphilic exporter-1